MHIHRKMIFLGLFIFFVSFVSLYPMKEGLKTKKKHKKKQIRTSPSKKDTPSKVDTSARSPSTPNATKVIELVRKFPFYGYLPYSMRTMFENLISFLIFI